jgi:hypothetical protein
MQFSQILQVLLMGIIILVIYNVLKIFVLPKYKINKWIVLSLGVISLFLPVIINIITKVDVSGNIIGILFSGVSLLLFLWFFDIMGWTAGSQTKKSNEKQTVIKPKAKPNRAKNKKQ